MSKERKSYEFETPGFLKNSSVEEIHSRMMQVLPDNWDKSEGSVPYDLTRPTAIEHSRLCEFTMIEAIKMIWPMFATGIYLDYHGKTRGLTRKSAIKSVGKLLVNGNKGGIINAGDQFSTQVINDQPAVTFSSLSTYEIPESGQVEIEIECTEGGVIGNVPANTIILKVTENGDILSVTNEAPMTGGIEEEDDDSFRDRIVEYDQNMDVSYVGSVSDYKRWANEVEGVGAAEVIPAQDDSGLVTIVIMDREGNPGSEELCTKVYNYIMRPDSPTERLTPPNAKLSVIPPDTVTITIAATIELEEGFTISDVKTELLASVRNYFVSAINDGEIRFTKICHLIGTTSGVYDYSSVKVNGNTSNIHIESGTMPLISYDSITLTSGTVS